MVELEFAARAGLVPFVSIPISIRYVAFAAQCVDRQTSIVDTITQHSTLVRLVLVDFTARLEQTVRLEQSIQLEQKSKAVCWVSLTVQC
jgi:hypothetical protein